MPEEKIEDFVLFYNDEFLPAYSDMVGFIAYKPEEVLTSLEHSFSHIMQYFTQGLSNDEKTDNLKKAHHHIQRATLDCYKIFWTEMDLNLGELVEDQYRRKFCVNMSEGDLLKAYFDFKSDAQNARQVEAKNVGVNYLDTINAYKKACEHGKKLFKNIDHIKMVDFDKIETRILRFITAKEFLVGLLLGIILIIIDHIFFQ